MNLPPHLELLRCARSVVFGPHGFFQDIPPETHAYRQALEDKSVSAAQLAALAQHGTASGRIYAACLLRALDPEAGNAALTALLDEDAVLMFRVSGSCSSVPTTMAECARWLLSGPPEHSAPTMVLPPDFDEQRQAQLREREEEARLRRERIDELNQRTRALLAESGGQPACPHCGARAAHRLVAEPADGELVYLVCSACQRSFNAGSAP